MLLPVGTTVAHYWKVRKHLGTGSFGEVVAAVDTRTGAQLAIKVERGDAEHPQLVYEYELLSKYFNGIVGVPRVFHFGQEGDLCIMGMERLGPSVETLRCESPEGRMSVRSIADVAIQAIDRLQALHDRGFVHRDIKPENLLYGYPSSSRRHLLYLIDFGLCKRLWDPETGRLTPHRDGKSMTGTPRYASLHAHSGEELSMRDDIEALAYVLVFLAKGVLPWQMLKDLPETATVDERYAAIGARKATIPLPELCHHLPPPFAFTIQHARGLRYDELPNYTRLHSAWKTLCT